MRYFTDSDMLVIRFNRQDWVKDGHQFWVAILAGVEGQLEGTGIIDRVCWFTSKASKAKITTRRTSRKRVVNVPEISITDPAKRPCKIHSKKLKKAKK